MENCNNLNFKAPKCAPKKSLSIPHFV
jgi:hypothetical protein